MMSMTTAHEPDPDIPAWMQAVDREAFYNADPSSSPEEDAASPAGPPAASTNGSSDATTSTEPPDATDSSAPSAPESSSLPQQLRLALGDTEQLPTPDPALQPVPAGSVRADLKRHLERAADVLSTRYTAVVSPSLVLEFALHRALRDLQANDTESELVQWLDAELPRT